ncbi:hypothetical protein PFISCL1PPCAC_23817, partial [Pristionchus fissidentatus]
FSSSDRLGNVLIRAFELLKDLTKNGIDKQNLKFAIESLEIDRKRVRKYDDQSESELRDFVYGLSESIEDAMESLLDFNEEMIQSII